MATDLGGNWSEFGSDSGGVWIKFGGFVGVSVVVRIFNGGGWLVGGGSFFFFFFWVIFVVTELGFVAECAGVLVEVIMWVC